MLISPKCEFCHVFETHQLIHNLKANIFILKVKKNVHFDFRGPLTIIMIKVKKFPNHRKRVYICLV